MASRLILPYADVGNGIHPSDGALLYFYESGTSTPKDTWTDENLTTPNTNPVEANASGVFPDIWISGSYKLILTDKNDVVQTPGEWDPVNDAADGSTITININGEDRNLNDYLDGKEQPDYTDLQAALDAQAYAGGDQDINVLSPAGPSFSIYVAVGTEYTADASDVFIEGRSYGQTSQAGDIVAKRSDGTGTEAEWSEASTSATNLQRAIDKVDGLTGGSVRFQNGTYSTDTTINVEMSGNYKEQETRVLGEAQGSTVIEADTVTNPQLPVLMDVVLSSGNTSGYNVEISNLSFTCSDTDPAARGLVGLQLGRGARRNLKDLTFVGFDSNIRIDDNMWLSSFDNISMVRNDTADSSHYGIQFAAGGTSNWFNRCFVSATDTAAYALRGDYSAIGTLAADHCTGRCYDFNGFNGSGLVLGAESPEADSQVYARNTRLILDSTHFIHTGKDDPATIVYDIAGSDVVVKAGRLGASDGVLPHTGALYSLGITASFEIGFYVVPDVTFDINPINAGAYGSVVKHNDRYTTGVLVNEGGGGRPSLGIDKLAMDTTYGKTQLDYYNSTPQLEAHQIYLDMVGEPRFDSTSMVEVTVSGISGNWNAGDYITGATGEGILKEVDGSVLKFHRGVVDGAFSGAITNNDDTGTATFVSSANTGKNFSSKKGPFVGDFMFDSRPDQTHYLGCAVLEDLATTGADTSKFGFVQLKLSGTTAERPPALKNSSRDIGFQYFDTTLTKPVWWTGTGWVDATGTAA